MQLREEKRKLLHRANKAYVACFDDVRQIDVKEISKSMSDANKLPPLLEPPKSPFRPSFFNALQCATFKQLVPLTTTSAPRLHRPPRWLRRMDTLVSTVGRLRTPGDGARTFRSFLLSRRRWNGGPRKGLAARFEVPRYATQFPSSFKPFRPRFRSVHPFSCPRKTRRKLRYTFRDISQKQKRE